MVLTIYYHYIRLRQNKIQVIFLAGTVPANKLFEAWPASTYRHLRGVSLTSKTVQANKAKTPMKMDSSAHLLIVLSVIQHYSS